MTPISSTNNATALSILQRMNGAKGTASDPTANASISVLGPIEPMSDASKQAVATIVAIVNDKGTIDLSSYGNANAVDSAGSDATIITGDGNDSISAQSRATIRSNGGNDSISTYGNANIDSGAGDDVVSTYGDSTINAGDGNDQVYTASNSTVDLGAGDDWVYGYSQSKVNAGSGNDQVHVYDYSTVDAGDGDDLVVTLGNSTITGGAGNDTLVVTNRRSEANSTFDNATVDGGDGDDYIEVNGHSTVTGGTGNDTIRLRGDGDTVLFNKGDGQDVIGIGRGLGNAKDSATIKISGYNAGDVMVSQGTGVMTVSFKGSNDTLTLQFKYNASAKLAFDDGSTMDLEPVGWTRIAEMGTTADVFYGDAKPVLHF